MKTLLVFILALISTYSFSQSIVGTWQMTDKQTCFQADMKESDTEKELEGMMGGNSAASVAKLIIFKKDGSGQEGIFSVGKKKGADMNEFHYQWSCKLPLFSTT